MNPGPMVSVAQPPPPGPSPASSQRVCQQGYMAQNITHMGSVEDFSMSPRSDDEPLKNESGNSNTNKSAQATGKGKTGTNKTAVGKDDKTGANAKSLSIREQIRREKNRAAVKKCRKRKNERLKELESLTMKLQEENSQLKDEVKRAKISIGMGDGSFTTSGNSFAPAAPMIKLEDTKNTAPTLNGDAGAVQIPASPPSGDKIHVKEESDSNKKSAIFHRLAEPTEATDQQLRMARLGTLMKLYDVKVNGSVDDLEAMLDDVYHPDMVLVSRGQENRGVDGIRNQWKRNKNSFPDIRFDSYDIAVQDASAERITIRWVIRGTLVKQVQYGDMVVPPNNIFNKLKDKEVKLAGYTYLTFAEDDHRIIEELQVIKQGYTYNVEQLKLKAKAAK